MAITNPYYEFDPIFAPGTKARSDAVNLQYQALQNAFDFLPGENDALVTGTATFAPETGAGDAYVVTMPDTRTAEMDGDEVVFFSTHANTGPATLEVDGLGPKAIVDAAGAPLALGAIFDGICYIVRYDATNVRYQLVSVYGDYATAIAAAVLAMEWAVNPIDDDVTGFPGQYSALHWADGASQAWAIEAEDSAIQVSFGGDGATTFSSFHWAQKALAAAGTVKVLTDIPTATPPTTEAVTGNFEISDANDDDILFTMGYNASNEAQLINFMHGGAVSIRGENTAGTPVVLYSADPDGASTIYHAGVAVAQTVTAANGGLQANNTLTGAGFERVLTESDGGGGGAAGSITYEFTGTVGGDPGANSFRLSTGNPISVTAIYFSDTDVDSLDIQNILSTMPVGCHIVMRNTADNTQYRVYAVTAITDNAGWYQFNVDYIRGNGDATIGANGTEIEFEFFTSGWVEPGVALGLNNDEIAYWNPSSSHWEGSGSLISINANTPPLGGRLQLGTTSGYSTTSPQILRPLGAADTVMDFVYGTDANNGFLQGYRRVAGEMNFGARISSTNTDLLTLDLLANVRIKAAASFKIEEQGAAAADLAGHGQLWIDSADDSLNYQTEAGVNHNLLSPNSAVSPFVILGDSDGAPPLSQNSYLEFWDSDQSDQMAWVGFAGQNLEMRSLNHGGKILITAEDAAGTTRNILDADPDSVTIMRADTNIQLEASAGANRVIHGNASGAVTLYNSNVAVAITTTQAFGGLVIDNQYSGDGNERVQGDADFTRKVGPVWEFNTGVGAGNPGNGHISFDSATLGSITQIRADDQDLYANADMGTTIAKLAAGDLLYFRAEATDVILIFEVDGASADQGGFWHIPVSYISGTLPSNSDRLCCQIQWFSQIASTGLVNVTDDTFGANVSVAGTDTRMYLQHAGVDAAWVRSTNTSGLDIRSLVHGAPVLLLGEDSGGVARTIISADPDGISSFRGDTDLELLVGATNSGLIARGGGEVELYYNNLIQLETVSTGLSMEAGKIIDFSASMQIQEGVIDLNGISTGLQIRGQDENDDGISLEDGARVTWEDRAFANHVYAQNEGIGGGSGTLTFRADSSANIQCRGNTNFQIYDSGDTVPVTLSVLTSPSRLNASQAMRLQGSLYLMDQSAADTDITANGQIWARDRNVNQLWWTDDTGQDYPVAYARSRRSATNASWNMNTGANDYNSINSLAHYNDNNNYTITTENDSSLNWPIDCAYQIVARGTGVITIAEGSGVTIYVDDGTGFVDAAGSCTLSNGVATLWRQTSTEVFVWGSGLTP